MSRVFPDRHTEPAGLNPLPDAPGATPWAISPLPDESEGLPPAMLAHGWDPRPVLESLRDDVVIAVDWPVIVEAAELTRLGRHLDLVELDRNYPARRANRWTEASFRVGRRQLARLRACRDLRVVQRYLAAVDDGRAQGWNPIVFGVALASFNLPYRQGLLHYAGTLLRGLAERGRPRGVSEGAWEHWMTSLEAPLPEAVQRLLPPATPTPGTVAFGER
ncbi:MAG: hypothetical protein RLZZ356_211 [Verrucomicrobiota bacterium]|jgi:urease accessory protein UreF